MPSSIKNKKTIVILIVLLIVLGLVSFFYVHKKNNSSASNNTKQGVPANQSGAKSSATPTDKPEQSPTPSKATEPIANASLTIDYFTQSGGMVKVSATATNSQPGTCYFGFTSPNTKSVSRSSTSVTQGSSQICSTEINEVEFTKLGDWAVNVQLTNGNTKVESTRNVTIN